MKRFIFCFLLVICFIPYVVAQSNFNFVVEDDEEIAPVEEKVVQPSESATEPEAAKDKELPPPEKKVKQKQPKAAPTPKKAQETQEEQQTASEEEDEEESKEDEERKIYIGLTDIEGTVASVRAVSYCSGVLVVVNGLKKTIQEISGDITIGNQTKNFEFSKVGFEESVGWPIQLVGNACESFLSAPSLNIKKCKVEGMSEKRCRSKLLYVPLGAAK